MTNTPFLKDRGRINAHKNSSKMLKLCKEHNVPIIMNSDAHIYYDVGNMSRCEEILAELDFPNELVLNYSLECLDFILNKA